MRNFKIKKPIDSLKVPKIKKIRKFLFRFTEIFALFVAVSVLFGVIFGPETPFFGQVFQNLSSALKALGEEGIIALASILLIGLIISKK